MKIRLYQNKDNLNKNLIITLESEQAHYLLNVLKAEMEQEIFYFNNSQEWRAQIINIKKQTCNIMLKELVRTETEKKEKTVLFASLIKPDPMKDTISNATQLGIDIIQPIITQNTVIKNLNIEKMQSIAIQSSQQCNRIKIPVIKEIMTLKKALELYKEYSFIMADESLSETSSTKESIKILEKIKNNFICLIIGPEGGFTNEESTLLKQIKNLHTISLGKNILRSPIATASALTLINATIKDE